MTAIIAFIQWFFVGLVFNNNVEYLPIWRLWYIYGLGTACVIDVVLTFLTFFAQRKMAKKWNVTDEIVYDALSVSKIHKNVKGWRNWTPEEFERAYSMDKLTNSIG